MASGNQEPRFWSHEVAHTYLASHQYWPADSAMLSPQAVSTILAQLLTALPKKPKVPIDVIHALATVLQFEDWDWIATGVTERVASHYTQSMDPCTAAITSLQETTQQLQKVTSHLKKANIPQESEAIGFTNPSYTSIAAAVAAPHAQAIANGEQQD
ncbi:hypothetical protein BDQ17DRAFT_1428630 [Cyathus striatus]|nr:hypothetical protein BDQ17DRAFT_1428630 [Cyathus striatus]